MVVIIAIVAILLAASLVSGCSSSMTGIIIAGSTSVQPYAEVLAEHYALLHPKSEIDVQGGGSSAGITAAMSGTADIGMSSRDLKGDELELWSVEIAKDGLAIIINPSNVVENLTLEQIHDIYTAKISDWSELGGHEAKIHIIAREEGSGTRSAFESLVMGDERITPKAIIQSANGAVRQLVSGDINSIGFISLGLVDNTVKASKIDGIMPSKENVLNGSYNLHRPFLFVVNGEPSGLTKEFIDFTLSPEGQQILIDEGLISLIGGTDN